MKGKQVNWRGIQDFSRSLRFSSPFSATARHLLWPAPPLTASYMASSSFWVFAALINRCKWHWVLWAVVFEYLKRWCCQASKASFQSLVHGANLRVVQRLGLFKTSAGGSQFGVSEFSKSTWWGKFGGKWVCHKISNPWKCTHVMKVSSNVSTGKAQPAPSYGCVIDSSWYMNKLTRCIACALVLHGLIWKGRHMQSEVLASVRSSGGRRWDW